MMTRCEILQAAGQAVTVDRTATHGDLEENFEIVADYWSTHLNVDVQPHDVALMLSLLKVARARANPAHADNWVDICGYGACGGEIATRFESDDPEQAQ